MESSSAYIIGRGKGTSTDFETILDECRKDGFVMPWGNNGKHLAIAKFSPQRARALSSSTGCSVSPYMPTIFPREDQSSNIYLRVLNEDVRPLLMELLSTLERLGFIVYKMVDFKVGHILIFDKYTHLDERIAAKTIIVRSFAKEDVLAVWARKRTKKPEP